MSALATLTACGFTPVYGPTGAASFLQGNVLTDAPASRLDYLLVRRIEERLGRANGPAYTLSVEISTDSIGIAQSGGATRAQLTGTAAYALKAIGTGAVLTDGTVESFTGYSTTGSTVSERAAQLDAQERLMTILADQIIDQLILAAPDLPR
ncbi:LPS assembly lipoprotein LptE [Pseudaestuariivita sp.]|uniref:LPS assembly lipoprotein LptE n=1 Tax=Pseudaestuariivita sp. TaxID=2211669 RepID=UPI0040584282